MMRPDGHAGVRGTRQAPAAADSGLDVRALSTTAGAFRLRDVSFRVPVGTTCAVVGPAGAGKTTLLETLAGLRPAAGGSIRMNGRDIAPFPPEAREVGMVYQHAYLFPHLTVTANVAYGARDGSLPMELLRMLDVDRLASRAVGDLSGGERQLVALARALASRPRLLLLDEPFGALDPMRRRAARAALGAVQREWGLTTVHVTHDLDEAESVGGTIVVLDAGQVRQVGDPVTVMRRPASAAVASFLGVENVLPCTVTGTVTGTATRPGSGGAMMDVGAFVLRCARALEPGPASVAIRATDILLHPAGAAPRGEVANVLDARVTELERTGAGRTTLVTMSVGGVRLVASLGTERADELGIAVGAEIVAVIQPGAVHPC